MPASGPVRSRRRSTSQRAMFVAAAASSLALALLTANVFEPVGALQIAALWLLGGGLLFSWVAILAWRIPVYERRRLLGFAALWLIGVGLSVWLVLLSIDGEGGLLWQRSTQWLALTTSLAVGGLFLRALLRVRMSPLVGRLLSLVSPIAILALIGILTLARA